ncbi:hypothetical protein BB559_004269 [Furculomyces boomerangus]|uniref:Uncharacterized protein n=1 Tax=Furculomyces boomerangus TaxID=61424 RepID=A0A2T9YFN4_9FUNG|nr:hypothetical protein BB559_004269 [Furculomyces boomerangus]
MSFGNPYNNINTWKDNIDFYQDQEMDDASFNDYNNERMMTEDDKIYNESNAGVTSAYGSSAKIGRTDFLRRESAMSEREDLYTALHYINQELLGMGMPCPLRLSTSPEVLEDNQRVVECILSLINQSKNNTEYQKDLSSKLRRSLNDEDILKERIEKLKAQLELSERKSAIVESKNNTMSALFTKSELKIKKITTELKSAKAASESNKSQFIHDIKRKEREIARLKERMQRVIVEKHRSLKSSVELITPIPKPRNFDESLDELKAERAMVDDLIKNYETNEKEILNENNRLEVAIHKIYKKIAPIYKSIIQNNKEIESAENAVRAATTEQLKIQYQEQMDQLSNTMNIMKSELFQKKDEIEKLKNQTNGFSENRKDLIKENEKYQNEISKQKMILSNQESLIEELQIGIREQQRKVIKLLSLISPIAGENGDIEASIKEYAKQKDNFEIEKSLFQKEKSQFTNAVVEMGKERIEVEKLRQNLKIHQISVQTAEFLSTLPPTPNWLKGSDLTLPTPEIHKNLIPYLETTPISSMLYLRRNENPNEQSSKSNNTSISNFYSNIPRKTAEETIYQKYNQGEGINFRKGDSNTRMSLYESDVNSHRQSLTGIDRNDLYKYRFDNVQMESSNERHRSTENNYNYENSVNRTKQKESGYSTQETTSKFNKFSETKNNTKPIPSTNSSDSDYSFSHKYKKKLDSRNSRDYDYEERQMNERLNRLEKFYEQNKMEYEAEKMYKNKSVDEKKDSEMNHANVRARPSAEIQTQEQKSGRAFTKRYESPAYTRTKQTKTSPLNNSGLRSASVAANVRENSTNFNVAARKGVSNMRNASGSSDNSKGGITNINNKVGSASVVKERKNSELRRFNSNNSLETTPISRNSPRIFSSTKNPQKSTVKLCTKPGCAAHDVHYHPDGTVDEIIVHEMKPPVPKFRTTINNSKNY